MYYQYDAYGNVMVFNYDSANIGMINPFRYRGYYQDSAYTAAVSNAPDDYLDIGLYYLQSRYYDPTMMGFISPDNAFAMLMTSSIPGGGTNLYGRVCMYMTETEHMLEQRVIIMSMMTAET